MITRTRAIASALALVLLVPVVANAQAPRNPFADLFGKAPSRDNREYSTLHFRSTAGAQWGQTLEEEFLQPDAVLPEGLSGGIDGALIGEYVRDRVQAQGQGRYSYQEFRQQPAFGAPAFDLGGRVNFDVRTRFSVQGGAHYTDSPFFQLAWVAPEANATIPAADRGAILLMQNTTVEGSGGITSQYTKRSSINLSAYSRRTEFELFPQNDFRSQGAMAMWRRQMSRDVGIHAGYGRDEMRQELDGAAQLFVNERLDIGVDFSKSLSLARRTTLSFTTETSMLRETAGSKHFRVNGRAELTRQFQRTWQVQLSAQRATQFLPGFRSPVFTENAGLSLAGYLAKRVILNINAEGGQGEVGFNDSRKFVSYSGNSKLTFAVTRHLGFFTQYVYFHYQQPADPGSVFFPDTIFPLKQAARQAVSVGIQTWLPIIDKDKVNRDPR